MSNDASALAVVDPRQVRGKTLAQHARIKKITDQLWAVPSATHKGVYMVDVLASSCTCPDHEETRVKCKHLWALAYARHEVVETDGSVTEHQTLSITYRQNWRAYNAAQTTEKEHFTTLLKSLCATVEPLPKATTRGRPRIPIADILFGAALKTYVGLSGRRATTDLRACVGNALDRTPHHNSVFSYLDRPEITPVLTGLIEHSAVPLASLERHFSADSTGFATSTYYRWYDEKYGKEKSEKKWVKAHAMIGAKTNVVTAIRVVHTYCSGKLDPRGGNGRVGSSRRRQSSSGGWCDGRRITG